MNETLLVNYLFITF